MRGVKVKNSWVLLCTAILLGVTLFVASPSPTQSPVANPAPKTPAKVIELTHNCIFAEGTIGAMAQKKWCDEVQKRSGGHLKIKFYSSGTLYHYKPSEAALAAGELDASQFAGFTMGQIVQTVALPCLFDSWDQVKKFHREGGMNLIAKGVSSCNMRPLFAIPFASITGIFRKPVHTLDDLKGLKLRSPTAQLIAYLKRLGATSVHVATTEVYQALQLGTIDGVISTTESFYKRKWYEGARYFLNTPLGLYVHYSMISLKKWDSLPPDIQNLMLEVGEEVEDWLYEEVGKYDDEIRRKLSELLETHSLPPNEYSRWVERAKSVWDEWAKKGPEYEQAVKLARQITGK